MSPDPAASVRARLLALAKKDGEEFERTLTRFAAERLLFRLGASAARDRCLLKGGSLLSVWIADPYRATRDVDVLLSGASDEEAVRGLVAQICSVPCPEDGLLFDLSDMQVESIRPEDAYAGQRVRFRAHLGQARIAVQLDIGVGDAVSIQPEDVFFPVLLSSLPSPRLRAYPRELTVAEKYEAMVSLGARNTRMKDFHDIWALAGAFSFEALKLQHAITSCFARRGTPWADEASRVLSPSFYQAKDMQSRWRHYLAAGAVRIQPPSDLEVVGGRIINFLLPLREGIAAKQTLVHRWRPGGPWSHGSA